MSITYPNVIEKRGNVVSIRANDLDVSNLAYAETLWCRNLVACTSIFTAGTLTGGSLVVLGSTLVTNLNAELLNGNNAAFYTNATNITAGTLAVGVNAGSNAISTTGTLSGGSLAVNSTTLVANLNAQLLNGNNAAFYTNATNITAGTLAVGVNAGSNAITTTGVLTGNTIVITRGTGTAPLSVNSTTLVANLNAQLLNGNNAAFYTNATNITAGTLAVGVNAGSNTISTTGTLSGGTLAVNSTTLVANLNAQLLNGANAAFYTNATNITTGTLTVPINAGSNAITTSGALTVGSATVNGSLTVTGNLTIGGNTTTLNTDQLTVEDPMVVVNSAGLDQSSGLFIVRPMGNNATLAYTSDNQFSLTETGYLPLGQTSFANLALRSLIVGDSSANGLSLNMAGGGNNKTGFRYYLQADNTIGNPRKIEVLINDLVTPVGGWTKPGFSEATQPTDHAEFGVRGTLSATSFILFPSSSTANSKTSGAFIRTGNRGQFTAAADTHTISIKNGLLAQNLTASANADQYMPYRNANNIMGTMMISVSDFGTSTAKNGFAMVSLVVSTTEMDVLPIFVHKNALLTTFSIGKSSDNGNVVVVTDANCRVAYQFYGALASA